MIEVEHLYKKYNKESESVLKDIQLHVAEQEVVVLVGPSGSGKSTLLQCLSGLQTATEGTIRIEDVIVDQTELKARNKQTRLLTSKTGIVFQDFNLFRHKTALDNIIEAPMIVKKIPKKQAEEMGRAYLEKVGMLDKQNVYPAHLSGGQQQRVAIARTLAMEPRVILFDEPTSSLDPEIVGEVLKVIRDLAHEGYTLVIVSHEMEFAKRIADRVVFMSDGEIIEEATPADFFENPRTQRAQRFLTTLSHTETGE